MPPSRQSTPAKRHDVHVLARELRYCLHEDRCTELFEVVQRLDLDELAELARDRALVSLARYRGLQVARGNMSAKMLKTACSELGTSSQQRRRGSSACLSRSTSRLGLHTTRRAATSLKSVGRCREAAPSEATGSGPGELGCRPSATADG